MKPEIRKPLIVGNWKMNCNISESITLSTSLGSFLPDAQGVEVAVAPPFTSLYSVSVAVADKNIALAAQNMSWEDEGAYTGEISGKFLKEIGCQFVILGHSERRSHFGESNAMINSKVQAALRNELIPILCVGETLAEREKSVTFEVIEKQLNSGFNDIAVHDFERFVVAYEPVWAIGTGRTATAQQAGEVHHFIRNWLTKFFDAPTADRIHLLYGGSVKKENSAELMKEDDIDGLLVGGASLDAEGFSQIVKFEERMNKSWKI